MVNIVYFGSPKISSTVLQSLISDQNFHVQAVVTNPDSKVGRLQVLTPTEVAQIAETNQIPTLKPNVLDEQFIANSPQLQNADFFIVFSYGKIIPQIILDLPKFSAINIHGSLLPEYRGASPIQSAILTGAKITGVTLIQMDFKMDHGPILAQQEINISPEDTTESLGIKMARVGADLLKQTIPNILSGKITPQEQDHEMATFCKILRKEVGFFDIENPPSNEVLDRMIRAYYPWPNVSTKWNGKIIKFYPNEMIQIEGKKPAKLADFLRGYPNFPIKSLS